MIAETFWGILFGLGALLVLFGKEEQQAFIDAPGQYPSWDTTQGVIKKGGDKIGEGLVSTGLAEWRYWPSNETIRGGSHFGGRASRSSNKFLDTLKKLFEK